MRGEILNFTIIVGAMILLAILFGGVMIYGSETCRNGHVWVDDERGKGCIPWEGVDK